MVCPAFATRDILPHPGRRSADPAEDLPGGGVGTALVTDSREATPCGTTSGMPLRKLAVPNYRCFRDRQQLEIFPVTVVLGKNNSHKSALVRTPLVFATGFGL
jgi:hypothetical protein